MPRLSLFSALAVTALLVVSGCNVLDTAYEEGGSVEHLIEDAAYARADGDFDRAVDLLEEAYALDPGHTTVRLDLARTLMQREDINLFDLARVTNFIGNELDAGAQATRPATANRSSALVCTYDPAEPARPFDPRDVNEYDEIREASEIMARVNQLLNDPAAPTTPPALPTELSELDACAVVQHGALDYNRDEILAALDAQFESEMDRNVALTMNAVALTLSSYLDIFENTDYAVNWAIVGEPGATRIGYCTDEANADAVQARIQANLDSFARALVSLDLYIYTTGNTDMQVYLDEAMELYEAIEADVDAYCMN